MKNFDLSKKQNGIKDISGFAMSYYNVALVCDGQIVGTLNLIKE